MVEVKLVIAAILGAIVCISPEIYLDTRIYDREKRLRTQGLYSSKESMQDKNGQFPWRVITFSLLNYIIITNTLNTPSTWNGAVIWLIAVFGVIILTTDVAWIVLDAAFNFHINKPLSFSGTTSKVDRKYGKHDLKIKTVLLVIGLSLITLHYIILA